MSLFHLISVYMCVCPAWPLQTVSVFAWLVHQHLFLNAQCCMIVRMCTPFARESLRSYVISAGKAAAYRQCTVEIYSCLFPAEFLTRNGSSSKKSQHCCNLSYFLCQIKLFKPYLAGKTFSWYVAFTPNRIILT